MEESTQTSQNKGESAGRCREHPEYRLTCFATEGLRNFPQISSRLFPVYASCWQCKIAWTSGQKRLPEQGAHRSPEVSLCLWQYKDTLDDIANLVWAGCQRNGICTCSSDLRCLNVAKLKVKFGEVSETALVFAVFNVTSATRFPRSVLRS